MFEITIGDRLLIKHMVEARARGFGSLAEYVKEICHIADNPNKQIKEALK